MKTLSERFLCISLLAAVFAVYAGPREEAGQLLGDAVFRGGLVVHVGCGAYNGLLLWEMPLESWFSHPAAPGGGGASGLLQRRLVAVGNRLFVPLAYFAPVSVLDGRRQRTCPHVASSFTRVRWHGRRRRGTVSHARRGGADVPWRD